MITSVGTPSTPTLPSTGEPQGVTVDGNTDPADVYRPGDSSAAAINSQTDFAKQLLPALGAPVTPANLKSIIAWEGREGGNWHNSARFNPLNTTQPMPGSTGMNSEHVQRYSSWNQGLQATVETLTNGHYGDVLNALKSGSGLGNASYHGLTVWSGGAYSSI